MGTVNKNSALRQLIETIDYLIGKYEINCRMTTKVVELIEATAKSSVLNHHMIKTVNKKVFTSGEQLASFMEILGTNQLVRV